MATRKILLLTVSGPGHVDYFFSSAAYRTLPTDSVPSQLFQARISNDPTYKREAGCRAWGNGRASVAIGYFDIINQDGKFDEFISLAQFGPGWTAEVSVLFDTLSYDARIVAAKALVVTADAIGEDTIRLTLSPTRNLEKPLSQEVYPNNQQVAGIRGKARPAAIGSPNWTLPVCQDTALQLYDVHFNQWFDSSNIAVFSRGVPAVKDTDWRISLDTDCFGFEYKVSTVGAAPITANLGGALIAGSGLITSANGGDFTTWSGSPSTPSGWSYVGTIVPGSREFVNDGAGACRIHTTAGGTYVSMRKSSITIDAGATLLLHFDVKTVTVGGGVQFRIMNSTGITVIDSITLAIDRVGHYSVTMYPGANSGTLFEVRLGIQVVDVAIDNLRLDTTFKTDTVEQAAHFVALSAGVTSLDLTSWAAIVPAALSGIHVGIFADGALMASQALDWLADSFNAWWWVDRLGNLKAQALYDPLTSGATPVDLSKHRILSGSDIQVDIDRAPGIAAQWGYNKNWKVMGDAEFAGAVSAADREKYSGEYQLTSSNTSGSFASQYDFADAAPPWPTVISDMTALLAATMPNLMAAIYGTPRSFKTFPMAMADGTALSLEPGDLVMLDLDRFSIDTVNHMVALVDGSFLSDVVTLKIWS